MVIGHGLMGVLMHPHHYLHSLVFSFTPGSVDLEKSMLTGKILGYK